MKNIIAKILSGFTGEKRFIQELINHLELSSRAIKLINDYLSTSNDERLKDISNLERIGDEISRKLSEETSRGAISPVVIGTIEFLLNKIDDILDNIHILSKELKRLYSIVRSRYALNILEVEISEMIRICDIGISELKNLLNTIVNNNIEDTTSIINTIKELEECVDDLKDRVLDKLYSNYERLSYVEFIGLTGIVFTLDNILDAIKDSAILTLMFIIGLTS